VDRERRWPPAAEVPALLVEAARKAAAQADCVILEDHGMLKLVVTPSRLVLLVSGLA
jgi:hypothetical protein